MPEARASLIHLTDGRARLRVPTMVGQPAEGRRLADSAAAIPGVSKVEARTTTGSLIIFHLGDWGEIARALEETAGLEIAEPLSPKAPTANALDASAALLDALDGHARRAFGGRTDLSELTFLILVLAGIMQLARGQFVGPAATLFAQALNLMGVRRKFHPAA